MHVKILLNFRNRCDVKVENRLAEQTIFEDLETALDIEEIHLDKALLLSKICNVRIQFDEDDEQPFVQFPEGAKLPSIIIKLDLCFVLAKNDKTSYEPILNKNTSTFATIEKIDSSERKIYFEVNGGPELFAYKITNSQYIWLNICAEGIKEQNIITNQIRNPERFVYNIYFTSDKGSFYVLREALQNIQKETEIWQKFMQNVTSIVDCTGEQMTLPNFNSLQNRAISTALSSSFSIVIGPPGTGKTTTIIGTILGILKVNPTAKIFISAPSNSADHLTAGILKNFPNSKRILYRHFSKSLELDANKIDKIQYDPEK